MWLSNSPRPPKRITWLIDSACLKCSPKLVNSPLPLPQATRLLGARPNPFHLGTSIDFTLSGPQHVRIAIYDLAGRLVRVLADRRFVTGEHSLDWNGIGPAGRKVAPAVYLIRLEGESATDESKAVFLK